MTVPDVLQRWLQLQARIYPAGSETFRRVEVLACLQEQARGEIARRGRAVGGLVAAALGLIDTLGHAPAEHLKLWWRRRHHRGDPMMNRLVHDARIALRTLRRRPGFTALSILLLATGLASSIAAFAIVFGVVLSPLPYAEPDRLVTIWSQWTDFDRTWVSRPEYVLYSESVESFERVGLFSRSGVTLGGERPERVSGVMATPSVLPTLGVPLALGRNFSEEEQVAAADVALISWDLWRRTFDLDDGVLGRTIELNAEPHQVIGVLPRGLVLPQELGIAERSDVWRVLPIPESERQMRRNGGDHGYYALARLREGVTVEEARVEVAALNRIHVDNGTYPEPWQFRTLLFTASEEVSGRVQTALWVVLAAAGLVTLIAAANVAGLAASQSLLRRDELVVRRALGAGRWQIGRQLLVEAECLALVGLAFSLPLAWASLEVLRAFAPSDLPRFDGVGLSAPVLVFAAVVATGLGLSLGLWPVLSATLRHRSEWAQRQTASRSTTRYRGALVAGQLALAVVLVVSTGLLLRTLDHLLSLDPGFDAERALTYRVFLPAAHYDEAADVESGLERLIDEMSSLAGVTAAGAVRQLPLVSEMGDWGVRVEGYQPASGESPSAEWQAVTPGYFDAIGIPVEAGRRFDQRDGPDADQVLIVNRAFERRYFDGGSALGKRVGLGGRGAEPMVVVGVVADVHHNRLTDAAKPTWYRPHRQFSVDPGFPLRSMTVVVRTEGDPAALVPAIRSGVAAVDPRLAPYDVQTLDEVLRATSAQPRFSASLVLGLALVALLLASVGVSGVVLHMVAQRRRELGVRIAVGAGPGDAISLISLQGITYVVLGVAVGAVAAGLCANLLEGLLQGVPVHDPMTYGVSIGVLAVLGAVACYLPARRAARLDPATVLRQD